MIGGTGIPITEVIIKRDINKINFNKLDPNVRIDLFKYILNDFVINNRHFERDLEIINILLEDIKDQRKTRKLLNYPLQDTIEYLIKYPFIIPIVSDIFQITQAGEHLKNTEIIPSDKISEKLSNLRPTISVVNQLNPYKKVLTEYTVNTNAPISRIAYRNNSKVQSRVIVENENIAIEGIYYSNLKDMILSKEYLQRTRLFKKQFSNIKYKKGFFLKFGKCYVDTLNQVITLLKTQEYSIPNTIQYNLKQINKITLKKNYINNISVIQTKEQIINTEKRFPQILLNNNKIIAIYGSYPIFGTLSDTVIQREKWITQSGLGSIPFYQLYFMLNLLNVSQFNENLTENYKELTNSNINLKRYFDEKCAKLSECDTEICNLSNKKCVSNVEISEYKEDLFERLSKVFKEITEKIIFSEHIKKIRMTENKEKVNIKVLNDKYSYAIAKQLTPYILFKLREISKKTGTPIWELLNKESRKLVDDYLDSILTYRKNWKNNKCSHFNLRNIYDSAISNEVKFETFSEMINTFGTDYTDNYRILCNNCGYNLGCYHEILLMKQYYNKKNYYNILDKLKSNFYDNGDGKDYYCKYCGRKLAPIEITHELTFGQDHHRVTGEVIEDLSEESLEVKNLISRIVFNLSLQSFISIDSLAKLIKNPLMNKLSEIDKQDLKEINCNLKKKLYIYAYIYSGIVIRIILKNFKFNFPRKYLDEKLYSAEKQNISEGDISFYKLPILKSLNVVDPDFIQEGLQIKKLKLPKILDNVFKDLQKSQIRESSSLFSEIQKIYGNKVKFDFKDLKDPNLKDLNIKGFNIKDFYKVFVARIKLIAKREAKQEYEKVYDNSVIIKIYNGNFNRKRFKYNKLKYYSENLDLVYNAIDYDQKTGKKQDWGIIEFIYDGKVIDSIKSNEMKKKLKIQKELFNMSYDPTIQEKYVQFSEIINILNISNYKKLKKSAINGKIKSEIDNKKLSESEINKIIENKQNEMVKNILERIKNNNTIYFDKDFKFVSGKDKIDNVLISKVKKRLLKTNKVILPSSSDFKIKEFVLQKKIIDKYSLRLNVELIEKIITKLSSNNTLLNSNEMQELLMNLGSMIEGYNNKSTKNQKYGQMDIIIQMINKLVLFYYTVKKGSNVIRSEDMYWLSDFMEYVYKVKVPEDYNYNIYNDIKYSSDISIDEKINILLNMFNMLVYSLSDYQRFIIRFLYFIRNELDLVNLTEEDIQEIKFKQENIRMKRTEKFLKMTPEEKIIQGFMDVKLEEQIEMLDDNDIVGEDEEKIKSYDAENEFKELYEDPESNDEPDFETGYFDNFLEDSNIAELL